MSTYFSNSSGSLQFISYCQGHFRPGHQNDKIYEKEPTGRLLWLRSLRFKLPSLILASIIASLPRPAAEDKIFLNDVKGICQFAHHMPFKTAQEYKTWSGEIMFSIMAQNRQRGWQNVENKLARHQPRRFFSWWHFLSVPGPSSPFSGPSPFPRPRPPLPGMRPGPPAPRPLVGSWSPRSWLGATVPRPRDSQLECFPNK